MGKGFSEQLGIGSKGKQNKTLVGEFVNIEPGVCGGLLSWNVVSSHFPAVCCFLEELSHS